MSQPNTKNADFTYRHRSLLNLFLVRLRMLNKNGWKPVIDDGKIRLMHPESGEAYLPLVAIAKIHTNGQHHPQTKERRARMIAGQKIGFTPDITEGIIAALDGSAENNSEYSREQIKRLRSHVQAAIGLPKWWNPNRYREYRF